MICNPVFCAIIFKRQLAIHTELRIKLNSFSRKTVVLLYGVYYYRYNVTISIRVKKKNICYLSLR